MGASARTFSSNFAKASVMFSCRNLARNMYLRLGMKSIRYSAPGSASIRSVITSSNQSSVAWLGSVYQPTSDIYFSYEWQLMQYSKKHTRALTVAVEIPTNHCNIICHKEYANHCCCLSLGKYCYLNFHYFSLLPISISIGRDDVFLFFFFWGEASATVGLLYQCLGLSLRVQCTFSPRARKSMRVGCAWLSYLVLVFATVCSPSITLTSGKDMLSLDFAVVHTGMLLDSQLATVILTRCNLFLATLKCSKFDSS